MALENAKDGYVEDSFESRLRVPKTLGLYLFMLGFILCDSTIANLQWWHKQWYCMSMGACVWVGVKLWEVNFLVVE